MKTHGGRRPGAGRKPGRRPLVQHRPRPLHAARSPVLVTLRAKRGTPLLRTELVYNVLKAVLHRQKKRPYEPHFQVLHFTIQNDHLHLIVEATHPSPPLAHDFLRKGVSGFMISFARRLNRRLGRRGAFWAGRHHRADLTSRYAVRRTLVYVFQNWKKHGALVYGDALLDPYSSAFRFDGWSGAHVTFDEDEPWPIVDARTKLLRSGWKEVGGLLDTGDQPVPKPGKLQVHAGNAARLARWRIVERSPSGH